MSVSSSLWWEQDAVGSEVQVVGTLALRHRQPLREIRLGEAEFGTVAVDRACLLDEILVEIDTVVDTQDSGSKQGHFELAQVGVAMAHTGEQLVAIGATRIPDRES